LIWQKNSTDTGTLLQYFYLSKLPKVKSPRKIKVKHGRLDLRRNFFSIRVIEDWNRIPADTKRMDKSENFKAAYRKMRANQMDHAAGRESGRDRH
jgi:hypothetical protein